LPSFTVVGLGFQVRHGLGDVGQLAVGLFLLAQGFLQQFEGFLVAHLLGPGADGAVGGDFVVLGFLGTGDEGGVGFSLADFTQNFVSFGDDAFHAFAFLPAGSFAQRFEDLFKTGDV